jgi:hypothetical protein
MSGRPMRACDVHAAASELVVQPLSWTSVKAALSAYATGGDHRFRRLRHGVYELSSGGTRDEREAS